jgi:hypothetical protein
LIRHLAVDSALAAAATFDQEEAAQTEAGSQDASESRYLSHENTSKIKKTNRESGGRFFAPGPRFTGGVLKAREF